LGCDWYAPDAEKMAELKTIALNKQLNYSYTPDITTRTVHS